MAEKGNIVKMTTNTTFNSDAQQKIKKILNTEYSASEMGSTIPFIYNCCGIDCNSWFAMNTITVISNSSSNKIGFSSMKWKVDVFLCGNKANEKEYIVCFYATNPTNKSDKYYIDQFGNCYFCEKHLLFGSFILASDNNIKSCEPYNHRKLNNFKIVDASNFDLLQCFEKVFEKRTFDIRAIKLFSKFKNSFGLDTKVVTERNLILQSIKVIFPLFDLLVNADIEKITFKPDNDLELEINGFSFKLSDIWDYDTFSIVEGNVKRALNEEYTVYNEQWKQIIDRLKKENRIWWDNDNDLEHFKSHINHRYGWSDRKECSKKYLGYGCLLIAASILKLQNTIPIKLSKFKNMIFWTQYKCTLEYDAHHSLDHIICDEENVISNLFNQFKRLLKIIEKCETSNKHNFSNNYSKAYHINAHVEELKQFCLTIDCNLPADKVQELQSVIITRKTDITTLTESCLKTFSEFYLKSVADFIFDQRFYRKTDIHDNLIYVTNIAADSIKGIKRHYEEPGQSKEVISTMHKI